MRLRNPPPLAVDTLFACMTVVMAVSLGRESPTQGWPVLDARAYALVGLAHLPIALRGRWPLQVFAVVLCASFAYVSLGYWPVVCTFGSMVALYTVASVRPFRIAVGCALCLTGMWVYAGIVTVDSSMLSVVTQALLYCSVLLWFGHLAQRSAILTRHLRAEQAERARRAVAEERGRIARELHDVVAHHMSVISVQAGLARFVFETNPGKARGALGTIADTSGEALEELRRMLQVLREEDPRAAERAPMPTLERLAELVERVRSGGLPVEFTVDGEPRPLPPGVELCAYRVVQEALTNVLKHAGRAHARVLLRYGPHELTVSVLDDGEGVNPDRVRTGAGHGLIGMRERAKLYGGTISVGPRPEGGFAVELTLPTSATLARRGDDRTG
ncbi:signal transduction histidine kinase [Streptomyces sp. Ag109_O5-1]|uniref:sensor histidine kinase n=1 Tax=Streptomyces sp. Ag109_O5-1 TaxID=1938851 RepID=UPI000F503DBF|nr:sensor histidine kinase [Streptomyces sp. Ag109_O5-1]RPE41354.1 signal transduction histidine kinase [Streptomyces sp. Ag109_O5-1]